MKLERILTVKKLFISELRQNNYSNKRVNPEC